MDIRRRGITLIELIIVLGIIIIISLVSFLSLQSRSSRTDLDTTRQEIVTLLRDAQTRATQQVSATSWGVYFSNSTTTQPFFALFSSGTYSSSTQFGGVYALPRTVLYATSSLASGATTSVVFSAGAGTAATNTSVQLLLRSNPSVTTTITASSTGIISYQ
jgi:type II secretory pathway pseudopilin PulG